MIPVSQPLLSKDTQRRVIECLDSGWISSEGEFIHEFEEKWSSYCGVKYGVAVANGTCALQIAVKALNFEKGSEIIIPSFTIISCAIAIIEAGCRPVLVDVDPDTWCIDVTKIEAKISPLTKAIMPVHMFGHPADMDAIKKIAQQYKLKIIEDAAEAHGAKVGNLTVGGIGDAGCFSFYANKIITTGEGGMIVTNSAEVYERAKSLRNLCFRKDRRFMHTELGYNFRLTNLQAAVGLAQFECIEKHISHKRWLAMEYKDRLQGLPISLPIEKDGYQSVYWMFGVVLDDFVPFDAAEFATRLRQLGIDTRPLFLGMHQQPVFQQQGLFPQESFSVTERLASRGLYLPSGLDLTSSQIDVVSTAVRSLLKPYIR